MTEAARAFFRAAGRGTAVVCIHSSASSSAQWRPLMDRLADRFRTLAIDLYGSGKSPVWPGHRPLTLADEAALLAPLFDAASGRCHLIGHSYGGAVALEAALAEPGRVGSLVLFEPVLFSVLIAEDPTQPAACEIAAVRDDTVAALERGNAHASGARFVDYWMGAGTWAAMPEPRRQALAAVMKNVKTEWDAVFREPTPLSAFAALDLPVLLITGSDSPASSREVARLLAKTLPRVTAIKIEGVGHMGPVTHPDRVNALIERYLTDDYINRITRRNGHDECDPDEHPHRRDAEAFRRPCSGL